MKAVVRYGREKGKVELRDVPIPKIDEGDVLIKIKAAGLCGSDINSINGKTEFHGNQVILGHEFAGEIVQMGKRVKSWKLGDRVVSDNSGYVCGRCHACIRGEFLLCKDRKFLGGDMDGGFAEYIKIQEDVLRTHPTCLMKIPDGISYEEAAILDPMCNGYNAVIQQGKMTLGDSVAVFGAGPLSLGAIQIAKAAGAVDVICIARSSTNQLHLDMARKLGATQVLLGDDDGLTEKVMEITKGEGVAIVLDGAGPNELFPLAMSLVRNGGKIVRIGYDWQGLGYSLNDLIDRNISLVGHMGYNPTAWKYVIKLLEAGMLDVKSTITHVMPLEDFFKGVQAMVNREAIKVVFQP